MLTENKYWFKLLQHYDSNNYFQNGLTLPFIIGSRTYIEPEKDLHSIAEIVEDFNDSSCFINVLKCETIGEYVFRIAESENASIYRCIDNFVIIDDSFFYCYDTKDIIKELEKSYNSILKLNKYSKIDSEWSSFSLENDISKFKEII